VKSRTRAAVFFFVAALSACSTGGNAVLDTARLVVRRGPAFDGSRLNPNFRYLRVTIEGRVAFLALGNEDSHPQGPIEVWYSAEREVLRLQNGRIVGATGLTTEWRNVALAGLPSWSAIASAGESVRWTRTRDVMPGYRIGVPDSLRARVVPPPARSQLQGVDPNGLTWFEEQAEADANALPRALYAVDLRDGKELVVYSEQCLVPALCFTLQRWSASAANAPDKK
jgi:hypothetical protein